MEKPNCNIGFTGLLSLLFIALKLTGVIGWPWLWVLSPIWITFGLVGAIFVVVGIVYVISFFLKG